MNTGNLVEPTATDVSKYSSMGGFSREAFDALNLPDMVLEPLVEAGNHSLAATTWASYQTALKHVARASKATGVNLTFPFDLRSMLIFVGYLLAPKEKNGRGLKGDSVGKYLSALRMIQLQKGCFEPWTRPEIVKQILKGASNRDQLMKRMTGVYIWLNLINGGHLVHNILYYLRFTRTTRGRCSKSSANFSL